MKTRLCLLVSLILVFTCMSLFAEVDLIKHKPIPKLAFSGFVDILYHYNQDGKAESKLGQFELDLAAGMGKNVSFTGAIIYDGTKFTSWLAFFKFQLLKKKGLELDMTFGQVDVPIGISYNYSISPGNKVITMPLANEKTINIWGDVGFLFGGKISLLEFVLYCVSGNMPGLGATDNGLSLGTRIGLSLGKNITLGVSYNANHHGVGNIIHTYGDFLTVRLGIFEFEAEAIAQTTGALFEDYNIGYFAQLTANLLSVISFPLSVTARFGRYIPESGEKLIRFAAALKYRFTANLSFKLVHEINKEDITEVENDITTFQVLGSF